MMAQVTHLLDDDADEQARQILAALVRGMHGGIESQTAKMGYAGDCRGVPGAIALLRRTRPEVTVAWGLKPLAAAVLAGRGRILFSPARFAGPRALRWIRLMMNRAEVTMVCPSVTQQRLAISRGIDARRCVVIPPAVEIGAVPTQRDAGLRHELGFGESDFIVLAPGESTLLSGHEHAVWASLILHVIDPACKLLVWGKGPKAAGLSRLPGRLGLDFITLAERKLGRSIPFEQLLGVADVCLATPVGMAPMLPIIQAMAAGVPIVAVRNSLIDELVRDQQSALTVPRCSPRELVRRVLDLRGDSGLRAQIIEGAQTHAIRHHAMADQVAAWRRILVKRSSVAIR